MRPLWTSGEAEAATGGRSTRPWEATGLSIDSRSLVPGDLFIALSDRRDGHDFAGAALARGAVAALVTHRPAGLAADAPLLVVDDVMAALERLGAAARARTGARVVAVTGSAGKTSTKEMLRCVLSRQGKTHAAEASLNNHWGVPLTLARLPADADFAVIEIGMNHPGEIAPLARLARPHVALVTTIGPAHLAAFPSTAAIAAEKGSVFSGLAQGGIAIFDADLPESPVLRRAAAGAGAPAVSFGALPGADWHLDEVRPATGGFTVVRATRGTATFAFRLAAAGRHFAMNALGALAAVEALGADPVIAAHDLAGWRPPAGRGRLERIRLDPVEESGFDLIDDAFNANPSSVAAGLDVLIATQPGIDPRRRRPGRRIAILGDMLELGPGEEALHAAIARHPGLAAIDVIHCVGPRMAVLHRALAGPQRGSWTEGAIEMAAGAHGLVAPGDVVLVKGSKGSQVSLVAEALRRLDRFARDCASTTEEP